MRVTVYVRGATAFQVRPRYPLVSVGIVRLQRIMEALSMPLVWVVQQIPDHHAAATRVDQLEVTKQAATLHSVTQTLAGFLLLGFGQVSHCGHAFLYPCFTHQ